MVGGVARRALEWAGHPVDLVAGGARPGDVVVLIYHRIGGRSPSAVDLPLAVFAQQLDTLTATGQIVTLDEALAHLAEPRTDDSGADQVRYVLTFDDGTDDWLDVVAPVLVAREVPATFYVTTAYVDEGRPFPDEGRPITWQGLRELAAIGLATIGSHTHSHRILGTSDTATTVTELDRSIGLLEAELGIPCRHFAYPNAVLGSAAAETVVRRRTNSAVLARNRPNRPAATDPHRLARHALTRRDDADAFARKIAGGARLEGWLREHRAIRTAS